MIDPRFLDTATEIVLTAGGIQMERRGTSFRIDKKGANDLVTEVDLECERMCRAILAERFPDHDVLAEEMGAARGVAGAHAPSRFRWVFDPLDGTTNYAHGVPIFCSSLALEIDGRPAVGAVYDPTRQELFSATQGEGARMNGERLRVSDTSPLSEALLVTGFPYDVHREYGDLVALFGAFLGRARAVRRLGAAALDLCYVAAGRFDGFWEQHLQAWDVSAGVLIVEEAGGRITGIDGAPFDAAAGHLIASNDRLHADMVAVVRECRSRNRTE